MTAIEIIEIAIPAAIVGYAIGFAKYQPYKEECKGWEKDYRILSDSHKELIEKEWTNWEENADRIIEAIDKANHDNHIMD